jgi:ribosome-associated protein
MAKKLQDRLNARGIKDIRIEGVSQGDWVVLDMGDIVVHLFRPEVRDFYNIEKMWNVPIPTVATRNGIHTA